MYHDTSDIINSLSGKTHTLGWDAVVAYDREKINHLLQQQYISKVAAGTHFPPITWENQNKTVVFDNLILGTPLISFEDANTENSRASAILEFIAGTVIEKNSDGQIINYSRIRPGMGFSLKLSIDLIAGKGSVDEEGKVLVDFSKGNITQIDLLNTLPAEVTEYFSRWLIDNIVIYELGQLSLEDLNTKFTPKKFVIRTQSAPESILLNADNYGNGAVLLFVATNYNPDGGSLPTNNYPWIIPTGNSSAILIRSQIVVENYIKPALDEILTTGSWQLTRGTGTNDAYYLKASDDATIKNSYLRLEEGRISIWTGNYESDNNPIHPIYREIHKDFIYSLKGARLNLNAETVSIQFDDDNVFKQSIAAILLPTNAGPSTATQADVNFSIGGDVCYDLTLNAENKSINFSFTKNNTEVDSDIKSKVGSDLWNVSGEFIKKIHDVVQLNDSILEQVSFDDIKVFSVDKVLFPEQNINQLASVYMPGDLAIFGNIDPTLSHLTLTPLTSTVAVGDSVTFATNTHDEVTYTISPKDAGTITATGMYNAPETVVEGTLSVTVTATTAEGASASAYITVVSTPILISPSFITLQEINLRSIQFNVKTLGENRTLEDWTLTSSNSDVVGTITQDGLYTPPDNSEEYPLGYTFVTVTATTSDGKSAKAYIILISSETHAEFKVIPSFVSLSPKEVQQLSTKETLDFTPDVWFCYPELGKLSKPEKDGSIYSVNYTAPDELSGDELVIVRVIAKDREHRVGYSLIDLTHTSQWDDDKNQLE